MKLTYRQIDPFVKNPDPKARAILIYGPDEGLMRERSKAIGSQIVPDLNDPFNVIVLSSDILSEDPARLNDEANAMSMMGGARLIRIEQASDKTMPVLKDYLADPSQDNLVIVEAGELGPRSPLRILFEKSDNAAALPCYVEDEKNISQFARQILTESGYRIDNDALTWLSSAIAGDRMRARSEIEKLMLYMGAHNTNITIGDVQQSSGDAGAQSLDDLVFSLGTPNKENILKTFTKLLHEGTSVIMILRALQNHFRRLHFVKSLSEDIPTEQALKSLQPPIFFKNEPAFKNQLSKWNSQKILTILGKLNDVEAQTKKTGAPVETLCAQAILAIS